MDIYPSKISDEDKYKLLTGSIMPRPIALISTIGNDGSNLAPFSFFTAVSTNPPMVGFTVMDGPYGEKDTLRHIRENGEFVINVVTYDIVEQMNIAATDFPPGISEFNFSKLTEENSVLVQVPRVAESKINLECKLHSIIEFGKNHDCFVVGEVLLFHAKDDIFSNKFYLDLEKINIIGRLSGSYYAIYNKLIKIKRKKYIDIDK